MLTEHEFQSGLVLVIFFPSSTYLYVSKRKMNRKGKERSRRGGRDS